MALIRGATFSISSVGRHLNARFPPLSLRSISATARLSVPVSLALDAETGPTDKNTNSRSSKVLLKGMEYCELEKWVQSRGYRPGQALMLWKLLYGNNIWAHCSDELEGLNKDFRKMLGEVAELKALLVKDILTASDGTRKDIADFVHFGRWFSHRNSCDSLQKGEDYSLCF